MSKQDPTYSKQEVFDMIRELDLIGLDILERTLGDEVFQYPALMMVNFKRSIGFRRAELISKVLEIFVCEHSKQAFMELFKSDNLVIRTITKKEAKTIEELFALGLRPVKILLDGQPFEAFLVDKNGNWMGDGSMLEDKKQE